MPGQQGDRIEGADFDGRLKDALIDSRQRYKDLVEISSDFAWETDAAGHFVFVSPQGVLGWQPQELLGRASLEFLVEAADADLFAGVAPALQQEIWFCRADGGLARLGIVATPICDAAGQIRGARGIGRDLTADRERDDALARAQLRDRLFTHLMRIIRDELEPQAALAAAVNAVGLALAAEGGVVLRRIDDEIIPAAHWGVPLDEPAFNEIRDALAQGNAVTLWLKDWHAIGNTARYRQVIEGAILLWRGAEDGGFTEMDCALLADVADQLGVAIAQVAQLEHVATLSRTDPLTGLLNRRAFFDELGRRLRRIDREGRPASLLYIDMDNFKLVNDARGHQAGDEAIKALTALLRNFSRGGDLVARLGGDEFALWIEGLGVDGGAQRAETLLRASSSLASFSGDSARPLGISIGVALVEPPSAETPEQLLARADTAMYRVKQAGKGGIATAPLAGVVPP